MGRRATTQEARQTAQRTAMARAAPIRISFVADTFFVSALAAAGPDMVAWGTTSTGEKPIARGRERRMGRAACESNCKKKKRAQETKSSGARARTEHVPMTVAETCCRNAGRARGPGHEATHPRRPNQQEAKIGRHMHDRTYVHREITPTKMAGAMR